MKAIAKRLDAHFAACAAAAGAAMVGGVEQADAAIVHSGIVNINIPSTTAGVYVNVVAGTTGSSSSLPGWDVNPWSSSTLNYFSPSTGSAYVQRLGGGATANLTAGTLIDAAGGAGAGGYGSSGAQTTGNNPHLLNSDQNLIGFRFFKEGDTAGTFHYGWMRISLGSSLAAQPRTLVEYAYEDQVGVGIAAGAVPAPGALALIGLAGVVGSRRRRHN